MKHESTKFTPVEAVAGQVAEKPNWSEPDRVHRAAQVEKLEQ